MPFAQQGPAGYQDSMVPFGEWLPDAARNIKPGFPLFWVNGSPVQLDDALNVIWTAGAYRPYGSPVALAATMASAPLAAFATYSPVLVVVAGTVSGLYWSDNYNVAAWTACGGGYTASDWSFTQYGQCVYAADGHDPIQVMDVTDLAAGFTALAASTAPVAKCLGVIRDFVVAGNIVSSPIGAPTGPNVIQWCGLAAPATWDLPNTQQARADQSGAQSLYAQYGAVQYIANGEELGMVFQQTGITRVQYVGGDVVFSFYTFERKRGLVNPHAAAQVGNTVFFLSSDGFYATDGTQVQPIGYGKVNRWFLADCTNLLAVQSAADVVNQCIVWNYPSASNPSG